MTPLSTLRLSRGGRPPFGRKAREAGVEQREGAAVYVVEVAKEGEVSVHHVDPVSGAVSGEVDAHRS